MVDIIFYHQRHMGSTQMDINLLVFLHLNRNAFRYPSVVNSDDIFMLVKSGSFRFWEEEGPEYIVKANEGALFRRDVLYHREIIEPASLYLFRYRAGQTVFDRDYVTFEDQNRVMSTLAMLDRIDADAAGGHELQASLFQDLAVQYAVENRFAVGRRETEDAQVMQAIRYIKTHLHMKITISQAGRESGLSQAQFIRRFKAFTGMTPQDYAASLKLQKAKSLLRDSDVPIQKVAELCGFENGYYFSNFFKKKTGMSPSGYRSTAL